MLNGGLVLVDDEDYDLLEKRSWHVYKIRPSLKEGAAATERRHNRMFRVWLHREVAMRMDPSLLRRKFRALPKNGNYLDCRRENIEISLLAPSKRGRKGIEPRAKGWQRAPVKLIRRNLPPPSPTWAGGFEYKLLNRTYKGEGYRVRKCIDGKPID